MTESIESNLEVKLIFPVIMAHSLTVAGIKQRKCDKIKSKFSFDSSYFLSAFKIEESFCL